MANKILINDPQSTRTSDVNYMGEITYKDNPQVFSSGDRYGIKPLFEDPIGYTIAKDVFSIITPNKYYDNLFNDIRTEKQGTGLNKFQLSALAQNDFVGFESLSAVSEDDSHESIIALSNITVDENYTDLTVFSFNTTISFNNTSYWYFDNGNLTVENNPTSLDSNYYFYIKFIDGQYCNIIKQTDSGEYYLTYSTNTGNLFFGLSEDKIRSKFVYSYNSKINNLVLGVGVEDNAAIIGHNNNAIVTLEPNEIVNQTQNTFTVDDKNALNDNESILNSFLPKYRSKNTIDENFEVNNIHLYTHNYNSNLDNNSNLIPLKNNAIYDEKYSLVTTVGDTHFRNYTSINSGIRGNTGYNNFIMSYNSEWYKYDFKPDKQNYFNIPFELGLGYQQINVNDCKLIENGSIGGNSPLNSDKIYKKLYEYPNFSNTGKTADVDNSQYLCSWLWFNPFNQDESKWLDRYYNPDKVNNYDALSIAGWNLLSPHESFSTSNQLDGVYGEYYNEFNRSVGVFDVESRMAIQPNCLYMYERLGPKTSGVLHSELSEYILDSKKNSKLDNSNNFYLITDTSGNDEEFTINLVLDNFDLDTFTGNKIFGNRTIELTVDKDFSPYNITIDGSIIHYYDFDYHHLKSLELSSHIDDIIFTDDFNLIYVNCGGIIYTVNSLDLIMNRNDTFSGNGGISDIKYSKQNLYILDNASNEIIKLSPEVNESEVIKSTTKNKIILINENIYEGNGEYIDYGDSNDVYTLSSNSIYYKDITTPIISSNDNLLDFYIDSESIVYVLKDDSIHRISNKSLPKTINSKDINVSHALSSFNVNRYQRSGNIYEYIDVYDKYNLSSNIHRYDKDLNYIETFTRTISGDFIKQKPRLNTKYLNKSLKLKITLFNIFNFNEVKDVELSVDKEYIDEYEKCILNIVCSNEYGLISLYLNGKLIDLYRFDKNKYSFSNSLRDKKIYFGGSIIDGEETINDAVLSSNNDMISGKFEILDASIYNTSFNYFNVNNYNRIYQETPENSLIIPIKKRSYIEEISGFYNQNKNMRKSEYGSINVYGTELSEENRIDVKNRINQLFEDTFINLRLSGVKFK